MQTTINPTEIVFSAVKSAHATRTHAITLADAAEEITGPLHAAKVARIREYVTAGQKDEASKLKRTLPAFMFSGTFARRKSDAILKHSGLLVLDFDGCGTEPKAALASDPHAVLAFVSPSGNGLKVVISIEADPATHGASFDAARAYFRERYSLDADPSGRDLARLCYVSHDPDAILKTTAELLHRPHMTIETTQDYISNEGDSPTTSTPPTDTPPALYGLCNIDAMLTATQPTASGQRHRKLFSLARGLRFDCGLADKSFQELKPIIKRWHEMALPKIGTQSFTESWSDFVHAWGRAKTPLSESSLSAAWQAVQVEQLPPDADKYDKPEVQKLVALCWHLARHTGIFYLSMHSAAGLLDCQPMQVKRYLAMLQADGLLTILKPGNAHTATTYSWKNGTA
jgi:hypothetical protein